MFHSTLAGETAQMVHRAGADAGHETLQTYLIMRAVGR
jgi:hypothetical protein